MSDRMENLQLQKTLKIGQQLKGGQNVRSQSLLSLPASSRSEIRLGRSESLKGREEMKRSRKTENVPRSRSDVDMDAAAEATRLHQSASSSASSLSTRWVTSNDSTHCCWDRGGIQGC
jgi:hypothetical protein